MNDREMRDLLRAESDAVVSTDPRSGFRAELRDVLADEWSGEGSPRISPASEASETDASRPRRALMIGMAAASVAVVAGGVIMLTRADDGERLVPTDSVVEPTIAESSGERVVLADWPVREIRTIDDVPHPLLPTPARRESVITESAFEDPRIDGDTRLHTEFYVDVERDAIVVVGTSYGNPAVTNEPDPSAQPIDPGRLSAPWSAAVLLTDRPAGVSQVELYDGPAMVVVNSVGLSEEELVAAASSLRRPDDGSLGWEMPGRPDGLDKWFGGETAVLPSAHVTWGTLRGGEVGITVGGAPSNGLLDTWFIPAPDTAPNGRFDTAPIGDRTAFVIEMDDAARVVWEPESGWFAELTVLATYVDDPVTEALDLARAVEFVSRSQWIDAVGADCPDIADGEVPGLTDGCVANNDVTGG